jgi:hypothetical protein
MNAAAILLLCALSAATNPADPGQAVDSGRKALGNWSGYPWYDAETDGVRRVDVVPPNEPKPDRGARDTPNLSARLDAALQWVAWSAVALVLAAILFLLLKAYLDQQTAPDDGDSAPEVGDADRIESLPFPVRGGRANLLDEARRLWQEGDYAQAVVYLFSYQLVHLDKQQVIRLNKGKTNRQYLREIGPRDVLQRLVEQTMLVFEDVFFGNRALERVRFEACWSRLDEFQALAGAGK